MLFDIALFIMYDCSEVKSRNIPTVNIKRNDSCIPSFFLNGGKGKGRGKEGNVTGGKEDVDGTERKEGKWGNLEGRPSGFAGKFF